MKQEKIAKGICLILCKRILDKPVKKDFAIYGTYY